MAESKAAVESKSAGAEEAAEGPAAAAPSSSSGGGVMKHISSKLHVESFHAGDACSFPSEITELRLVSPPRQRQRWGDKQMLPHTNWGDLFFDLFYVAAAYNLSNIILDSPTAEGVLYFIGLFGPIISEWFTRMSFDARFAFSDDPAHRLLEVLHLCFLATAVVHIRTVDVMSHPSDYPDMFGYSLGCTLLAMVNVLRNLEVLLWVDGEKAAKNFARRDILNHACQLILYLAAAVVSGTQYYSNLQSSDTAHDDGSHRSLYASSDGNDARDLCSVFIDLLGLFAKQSGLDTRYLAEASDYDYYSKEAHNDTKTNVPLWLCLAGWIFMTVYYIVMVLLCFPGGGRHKQVTVPMNIDFCIHRLGEWTMLLLGESILSLLIVETSTSASYYVTFYAGIVSVVLMQYLHFRSQPHHANEHAMRRNKNAGMIFSSLMQVYSFALVAVGVSFKMLLYEYTYEEESGYRLRRLLGMLKRAAMRHLAGGGGGGNFDTEERRQRVANFFCGSMAIAWICLDLMILTHHGIRSNVKRCECQVTKKISKLGIVFVTLRVGLIAFVASLSQYVTDPTLIAVIGMASVVAQVLTRLLGDLVYPKARKVDIHGQDEGERDSEDEKWPNVTHARAKPADDNKDEEHGTL